MTERQIGLPTPLDIAVEVINRRIHQDRKMMIVGETPDYFLYQKLSDQIERRHKETCLIEQKRRLLWWNQGIETKISETYQEHGITVATSLLVGSTAYGTCKPGSDIDIAVVIDDQFIIDPERIKLIKKLARDTTKHTNLFNNRCVQRNLDPPAKIDFRPIILTSLIMHRHI